MLKCDRYDSIVCRNTPPKGWGLTSPAIFYLPCTALSLPPD
nr:MAG TPA: hypothetical protein [Caudoviricetes sp.]